MIPNFVPDHGKQVSSTYCLIDRFSKADLLLPQLHHGAFGNATRQADEYRLHRQATLTFVSVAFQMEARPHTLHDANAHDRFGVSLRLNKNK